MRLDRRSIVSSVIALLGVAMLATGVATAAGPSGDVSVGVTPALIDIAIADGSVDFGTQGYNTIIATAGGLGAVEVTGQRQTVTNIGTSVNLSIKYTDPPGLNGFRCSASMPWLPGNGPGVDIFSMGAAISVPPATPPSVIQLNTNSTPAQFPLGNPVALGATRLLDFRLSMPTSTVINPIGPCTVATTLLAATP